MAVIDSQLISSATLQDELVNKLGLALSAGIVTFTKCDGVTLKNWYYQSGTLCGPFTYIAGPNPMTLSAAGTFVDVGGNDVIPFWNPWSEIDGNETTPEFYNVKVVDQFGQLQFTRANFPSGAGGGSGGGATTNTQTLENYVLNNRFWRNVGAFTPTIDPAATNMMTWTTQYNNSGTVFAATLAPSQHDSFSMPDFVYIKNNQTATEVLTFNKFALQLVPEITGDITPEYYLNHTTSVAGTGETLKVYQFPISLHVETLSEVTFAFTIQTQSSSAGIVLPIYIYQYLGTGVASAAPVQIGQVTTSTSWVKSTLTYTFSTDSGDILSSTSDDAWYLQIGLPRNTTTNFNFTLPSIYLGNTVLLPNIIVPTNSFQTYDQIDTIINSWRTGDVRTSLNSFYFFGWIPMNNGTIGSTAASAYATCRANNDTWPLYNLIWQAYKPYNGVTYNIISQMYNSSNVAIAYGATAYADWLAGNVLTLTRMMGQVILGTVPAATLLLQYQTTFTASSSTGLLLTAGNAMSLFNGMPVYVSGGSLPSTIGANTIYYVSGFNGTTTFYLSTTFANAMAGVVIAYAAGSGTVTSALAATYEGEYAHTQLLTELAQHTHNANAANFVNIGSGGVFTAGASGGSTGLTAGITGFSATAAANVTQPGTFMNIFMKL
jgi:hypothetical protein